jgi:putative resolvase
LSDPCAIVIVVGYRGRLARVGVGRLGAALAARVRRVVVVDLGATAGDLVRDVTGLLTGGCAGLCGRGGARNRALGVVTAGQRDPDSPTWAG